MAKQVTKYEFYNPNTKEATAKKIIEFFIESNIKKVEELIKAKGCSK
jgi:hypothetical protein